MEHTDETRGADVVQAVCGGKPAAAVVSAGNVETPYFRLGQGPSVVVLGFWRDVDSPGIPADLRTLGWHCRMIVPDLDRVCAAAPPVGKVAASFSAWLGGFLDGLGLNSARLVASWVFEEQLMTLLPEMNGRIDRIVIVGGAVLTPHVTPAGATAPFMVWRAGSRPSWSEIGRFLTDPDPPI